MKMKMFYNKLRKILILNIYMKSRAGQRQREEED